MIISLQTDSYIILQIVDLLNSLISEGKICISVQSCNHFGCYGEEKKYLATKVLVKVVNWQPTD